MRIFIDLSLSKQHLGTPHGLARVEVAIARELRIIENEVIPIWQNKTNRLILGFDYDLINITDGDKSVEPAFKNFDMTFKKFQSPNVSLKFLATQEHLARLKEIPVRDRLLVLVTYGISLFPPRISTYLWRIAKLTFAKLRHVKITILPKPNQRKIARLSKKNLVRINSFIPDDVVLICGNDWNRRIYEKISSDSATFPKLAFLIYDLIPYEYPNYAVDIDTASQFTYWISDIAQRSSYLFFISKFSQERFNQMLKDRCILSEAKQLVLTLPPGLLPSSDIIEPQFAKRLNEKFILVVSTLEARKNHHVLVSALRLAISKNEDFPQLVFIGSPGWGSESLIRDLFADEKLHDRVILKSGVTDSELRWLYLECSAVAYPSFVEGFGLPVYEAAVFKKSIVTSDCKAFDEIPHPHRVIVNPYDVEGWKNAIQLLAAQNANPNESWPKLDPPTWNENVIKMIKFMQMN